MVVARALSNCSEPAVAKRIKSLRLNVKVVGWNPPSAGQVAYLAALGDRSPLPEICWFISRESKGRQKVPGSGPRQHTSSLVPLATPDYFHVAGSCFKGPDPVSVCAPTNILRKIITPSRASLFLQSFPVARIAFIFHLEQ